MADVQYDTLELVGVHLPDFSMETNADGVKERVPLPGSYSVGVLLGGKYREIFQFKAGDIVDKKNKVQVGGGKASKKDDAGDDGDTGDSSES
jgi:hypothetical protein